MTGSLLEPSLIEQLGRLVPGGRRTAHGPGGGLHRSPFKGSSVEFRQHRLYVSGDDVRRLDWRVLARTDRPFIREYDDETTRRTMIVVDGSGSMAYGKPGKAHDTARLAAAFAYIALAAGERAGLLISKKDDTTALPPASVASQLSRIMEKLGNTEPAGETVLEDSLGRAATIVGRRSLVIVISDLMFSPDQLRRGLARLRFGRNPLAVVRVIHPDERKFQFRGWTRLRDLETGQIRAAPAAAIRNSHVERFDAHDRELRHVCRSLGADFVSHEVGHALIDTIRAVVRRGRQ
ncbi:MAG: DUF58 domain-containing protein [Tepidisphaeraceae bacterium]